MKKKMMIVASMLVVVLGACRQQPPQETGPRPVKLDRVLTMDEMERSYSGVVSPDQFSDLAFKMSGLVVRMNVVEGQQVKQGQVLVELDASGAELDLEAAKASYLQSASLMQRAEKLLQKNAISVQEYESTQAAYVNAQSVYENAQSTLNATKLRAPFDGFIQKKYVENYQRVQPGQAVVCLINPDKLQVVFTMPENNLPTLLAPGSIFVEFDAYKDFFFRARLKEYVEASPDGAGVPVFLAIDDPTFNLKNYPVAVGFSCRIVVNTEVPSEAGEWAVPLSAVVFDNVRNGKAVFVYNPSTGEVDERMVRDNGILVGRDFLVVSGDLKAGDQVVSAGASYLVDGQEVKVLDY